jgi:hypothetical protein
MKNINKLFIFLTTMFIFLTISSCSPQKRLQNLLRKNPELLIIKKKAAEESYVEALKKGIPKQIVFFGSREAVMVNLYGNLQQFLDNYRP